MTAFEKVHPRPDRTVVPVAPAGPVGPRVGTLDQCRISRREPRDHLTNRSPDLRTPADRSGMYLCRRLVTAPRSHWMLFNSARRCRQKLLSPTRPLDGGLGSAGAGLHCSFTGDSRYGSPPRSTSMRDA